MLSVVLYMETCILNNTSCHVIYVDGSSDSSVPTLPQIFDDSVERAMYDEIFGSILHSGNNRGSFSKPTIPKASHTSQG